MVTVGVQKLYLLKSYLSPSPKGKLKNKQKMVEKYCDLKMLSKYPPGTTKDMHM
jgi:hypothetical protein